ncbi:MAG: NAD(P)H-hydrate dehydratase [Acidimicrobiales bacterium]
MLPVVTVAEMRAADAAAPVSERTLVARAGTAVAVAASRHLGRAYGRRVVVVAGKGNNGADGRVAAAALARRGARVEIVAPDASTLPPCDLVVDAAFGTGFRGTYDATPVPRGARVLAVDIPSGVDGDTGDAHGRPMAADWTVTFAAWKPGLLQGDGRQLAGDVQVADIGLPVGVPAIWLVDGDDVAHLVPRRPPSSHKWATALAVVAGSPGMEGAAVLASRGASRAGAGMVRLAVPGGGSAGWPVEAVRLEIAGDGWSGAVLDALDRCRALVVGPGLGRDPGTQEEIRRVVAGSPVPVVVDADALFALGDDPAPVVAGDRPVVLTPHDGEYGRLAGTPPGPDRVGAARRLARASGAVVLLKGSLTAVAAPDGRVLLSGSGSSRLATAGTGDVLSGVIGALLARGVPAGEAAAVGAHVHGLAAGRGPAEGLIAGDLPDLVGTCLSELLHGPGSPMTDVLCDRAALRPGSPMTDVPRG